MQLHFVKYHGAGNDFILIDDRAGEFQKDWVPVMCDRRRGIGADGVILLQPSSCADFRMKIFNADGSEPAMCGNGLRCLVDFLHSLSLIEESVRVETGSGVLSCRWGSGQIAVNLGVPKLVAHSLPLLCESSPIYVVDTGVPHCIFFVEDVGAVPLEVVGPRLRYHAQFSPHGVNVNAVALHEGGEISVRTYERGVEGETLACGTGAAASAWLAAKLYALPDLISVKTQGDTQISVRSLPSQEVELIGPAVAVYSGIFHHISKSI